ncbi:hypothetical protein FB1_19970 [Flavobacterium branchiophilum NBRC 15030 = ATCC 35035]|uniref:Uncharacterized protein DUF1569 n=2 Tax=Flavobacterium branchiophilum TaxID=55197 RepID=A0A543G711_9FLAO|nr:DUF1569 domain-containing protein [Flavobacterium branchiophilum]TQM41744.1 uncharacterized protein DUF1569 [Flavobacterium branchiophilum]GEM55776.1 hypothetical protein FB1_19970 [Flavobacterium branchiophilum NBRC 15030 = ATCC 35035]
MTPSIFNQADNQKMIERIQQLSSNSGALWGKMTVNQMFKHCAAAIDVALGNKDLKINFVLRILGSMMRKIVLNAPEFKKNVATAKEFVFTGQYDFDASKQELIEKFQQFAIKGPHAIKDLQHPFWGNMTYDEWDVLMWKHLNHHLTQFGV